MAKIDLYPHQQKAYQELDHGKILTGGVGSGKTITSLAYFLTKECNATLRLNGQGRTTLPRSPKDLYIITTAKKRDDLDWEKEAALFSITTDRRKSFGGIQLRVDSWNNIGKYVDVKDAFFIFDEQRLVGSGAWVKAFLKIAKANRWIMLSATPGDVWMDYYPVFRANGFYKNKRDFEDQHVIWARFVKFPKIDRYVNQAKLLRLRREILVEMPLKRHTTRHLKNIVTEYDKELYEKVVKKKWNFQEMRPARDVAELFRLMRLIVNSDQSRLVELLRLWNQHPRLIVFYNFNYELDAIRDVLSVISDVKDYSGNRDSAKVVSLIESKMSKLQRNRSEKQSKEKSAKTLRPASFEPRHPSTNNSSSMSMGSLNPELISMISETAGCGTFQQAEWNGQKHEPVPDGDRWIYLVQYTAGAEGWNCITTDAMVFYSLNYSYKIWEQSKGRIDRINTKFTDLYYYVLRSKASIDIAIMKSLREKKTFNEKAYTKAAGMEAA